MNQELWSIAVFIVNIAGGGTMRHAREIVHAWSMQGCQVLYVEVTGSITHVTCQKEGKIVREHLFIDDQDGECLEKLLQAYHVQLFHVEHLINAPAYFLTMHKKLGIPLVVVMHDYYMICPFIKLTDEDECYCGEKGASFCQKCLARRKFVSATSNGRVTDIRQWRQMWEKYLESAALVIVPSMDMEERVRRYYPYLPLRMMENPELINWHGEDKRIGLIGSLGVAKGGQKIKECLSYCATHQERLHFYLFGTLSDVELTPEENAYITVLGAYDENDIYSQIPKCQIDFFWFPGIWPETYSYTLSIPIRLGIPCISTDLGAIACRITQNHWGKTYPWQYGADKIVRELNSFSYEQYKNPNFVICNSSFGSVKEYYLGIKISRKLAEETPQIPISDDISKLHGTYAQEEFHVLWKAARGKEKIYLLWHVDRKWVRDVLKKKGVKYVGLSLIKKYLKGGYV